MGENKRKMRVKLLRIVVAVTCVGFATVVFAQGNAKLDSMLQYYRVVTLPDSTTEYHHNNLAWAWLNETNVYVAVSEKGRLDLIACYRGEQRNNPIEVGFKIGLDTTRLKVKNGTGHGYQFEDLKENGVRESVRFSNVDKLIDKLVHNYKHTITFIVFGKDGIDKVPLTMSTKQAIRDSYELSKALKESKR